MSAELASRFLGRPVRRLPSPDGVPRIYLTFDDGPEPGSTEAVLDRLAALGAPATFFVVAEKARRDPSLPRRARDLGHGIGNHSLDHRYGSFFSGRRRMLEWVRSSESLLSDLLGESPVGFRPPAGVRTPELAFALDALEIPLVLWDLRFFDAIIPWSESRALRSMSRIRSGAIVLLHDRQPLSRLPRFLDALTAFVSASRKNGFELKALRRENFITTSREKPC